jgi:hypothetical protein
LLLDVLLCVGIAWRLRREGCLKHLRNESGRITPGVVGLRGIAPRTALK